MSGEELSEAVEVLSGLGIVSGYSDGSYHPDDALTRAQFCKLAILTEGHGDQARGSAYRTRFSDVPGGGWAAPYINLACEEGLVSGYGDGRFGPDDPVTVGQAVTVVLRLLGYTAEEIGPFWPEDYLNKAGARGASWTACPQGSAPPRAPREGERSRPTPPGGGGAGRDPGQAGHGVPHRH